MWGRRRKRGSQLSRQLALALLDDAMARAERTHEPDGPESVAYPRAGHPAPAVPAARTALSPQDVPVDNSAGPGPRAERQDLPAQRSRKKQGTGEKQGTEENTRHGSFG